MANPSASRSSEPRDDRLAVGLVRGVHGLRGAVRVEILTDQPEERFRAGVVLHREGADDPLTIVSAEAVADGPGWRVRFREIPDRTAAEGLRGAYLEVDRASVDALPRGAYYWHEVVGTTVRDADGVELGRVHDIYRVAETEVLVVRSERYGEFDVPVVRSLIRVFAPRRGEIVVDAPALDLREARRRDAVSTRPQRARRRTRDGAGSAGSPDEHADVVVGDADPDEASGDPATPEAGAPASPDGHAEAARGAGSPSS